MMRRYARTMGVALFGLGVLGVLMGEQPLLGWLKIDLAEDVVHLVTSCMMAAFASINLRHDSPYENEWNHVGEGPRHSSPPFPQAKEQVLRKLLSNFSRLA